jgi:hypothetical protein
MMLFVRSSSGADGTEVYAEISPDSGGYVIPQLQREAPDGSIYHFAGFSRCFKWGHASSLRLLSAPILPETSTEDEASPPERMFSALGQQLPRDLLLRFEVRDVAGVEVSSPVELALSGIAFTTAGCACRRVWVYRGETYRGSCANPTADPAGPWCFVEPDSCPVDGATQPADRSWDYCQPATTLNGCTCLKVRPVLDE